MSHTHKLQMVDTYSQTFLPLFPLIFFPSSKLLSPPITFIPSITLFFISLSIPPFPSTNIPRYLNSSTSSNFYPAHIKHSYQPVNYHSCSHPYHLPIYTIHSCRLSHFHLPHSYFNFFSTNTPIFL